MTVLWEKVDGPGTVVFEDANSEDTTATFSIDGTYVLRLTADDGELSGSDDVTIVVRAEGWVEITFDNSSSAYTGTTGTGLSWSHTVGSGSNGILVVGIGGKDTSANDLVINSITYNGVNMTLASGSSAVAVESSNRLKSDIYYLLSPPAGTYSIQVTYAGNVTSKVAGAVSLFGVAQQGPESVAVNTEISAESISTNITTVTAGAWVVDIVGAANRGLYSATGNEMVQRWMVNPPSTAVGGVSCTRAVEVPGTVTLSWDHSQQTAYRMAHSLAAFAPGN
jgi:hypothetical protein